LLFIFFLSTPGSYEIARVNILSIWNGEIMEIEEFEERAKSIVEVELKKITAMVKKIPDKNAKKQATLLGLSTIDVDIKSNSLAFNVLKNFVENMILDQVEGKTGKIKYEQVISDIVDHIMTFCIGYKDASLKPSKKSES